MELEPVSIAESLEWLCKAFQPDAAESLRLTYQLELTGERGGALWISIDNGRLEVGEGVAHTSDLVFSLAAGDFFGVLSGRENPDLLFMADRLKIEGDLSLALKLRTLFARAS
jgi:predicted lipid carrier protein YhbT